MTDEVPAQFDPTNPTVWGLIVTAFEVAPFLFGPPVAIHVIRPDGSMTYLVGVLSGTEDTHGKDQNTPSESLFYFKDADMLTIDWRKTVAVLAMVSTTEEVEPA
jgi:hypothetical protein